MTLLNAAGWTLIHFLWQGAIIVTIFAIVDAASRRASAKLRYLSASAAMFLMFVSPLTTFVLLTDAPSTAEPAALSTVRAGTHLLPAGASVNPEAPSSNYLPWLVYFWMAGVTALSARFAVQWVMLARCRREVHLLDDIWQQKIDAIVARLRLKRAVYAYESAIAEVPAVIGWLRPVVLVPASAILQLAPDQIEALIAHEIAHERRHDYLVSLLQSCVETLFFYHPGVWWVGRRMREERENCCDDLAVAVCGDAMVYARALADLEQFRKTSPELAMAANGGSLLNRIERLIAPGRAARPIAPVGITVLSLVIAGALLWATPQASTLKQELGQAPKPATPETPGRQAPSPPPKSEPEKNQESYLDQIERAGYRNLTVDQMISMKIHGVNAAFIAEIKALGWSPTPDELVSFAIHGVNASTVNEMRALGYQLTPDQAISARIHGVNPAYANDWKQHGLKDLDFDSLISLKIHGAEPNQLRDLKALGFSNLSADDLVTLRISGVTTAFIRETRARFRDLRLDQIVQLKQPGILDSKESK